MTGNPLFNHGDEVPMSLPKQLQTVTIRQLLTAAKKVMVPNSPHFPHIAHRTDGERD